MALSDSLRSDGTPSLARGLVEHLSGLVPGRLLDRLRRPGGGGQMNGNAKALRQFDAGFLRCKPGDLVTVDPVTYQALNASHQEAGGPVLEWLEPQGDQEEGAAEGEEEEPRPAPDSEPEAAPDIPGAPPVNSVMSSGHQAHAGGKRRPGRPGRPQVE